MPNNLPNENPLSYLGVRAETPPNLVRAQRAPTANDAEPIGTIWLNEVLGDSYQCTRYVAGAPDWDGLGGSAASLATLTTDDAVVVTPVANNINLVGGRIVATTGAGANATFNVDTGTSAARVNATNGYFSADGNILQTYAITTGGVVGTTYRALRADLQQNIGNGTESPQASRGSLTVIAAGDIEEGYGGYFEATQNDGSFIDSNLVGSLALATVSEVTPADQPQQWIAGSQSICSFGAAAGIPTASIVCANLNHVTYDAAINALAHGVVVSRNGAGAGTAAAAAYKVVIGSGIVDWNYGLDLLNGGVGALGLYGLADIRLANGTLINSTSVVDTAITCTDTGDFNINMTNSNPGALVTNTVAGVIAAQINGLEGRFINAIGATVVQESGLLGYCEQRDGSIVSSTATGVEGWLNLIETGAADLPALYAFAVKGYLDSTDTAGIPVGMVAGVGSVVEYNTPLNAKAYGFLATRLNTGAGAGTAAQAAYGVLQGPGAIPDWLYGLDLASGAQVYTTADIRLWSGSTLASSAAATTLTTFAGDNLIIQLGDNAAANTLIIQNTTPATLEQIDSLGRVTQPLQPAFLAYLGAAAVNKTGNGGVYTLGTDALTEVYDRGTNFNVNGTFTAPVTGIYDLRAQVAVTGCTIAATFVLSIITTARTYTQTFSRAAGAQDMTMFISCLADMAATNTATVTIQVTGEAGDTDDINGGASCLSYFCGCLVE